MHKQFFSDAVAYRTDYSLIMTPYRESLLGGIPATDVIMKDNKDDYLCEMHNFPIIQLYCML